MAMFRDFVSNQQLKELYMHGRLYTWSNDREVPTMSRIDRCLVSTDWDLEHPDSMLQALSSAVSDHAPLHLSLNAVHRPKHRFRFELAWTKLDGFMDALQAAWHCDPLITDPFKRIDALLRSSALSLQAWGPKRTGDIKIKLAVANAVIL
jgi:hypothetical protein